MKHISLLIPEGESSLSNIEASYKIFTTVNQALAREGKPPLFKIQLVGLSKQTHVTNGLFTIQPGLTIREVKKTDLVIIPAVHGDAEKVVADNRPLAEWIARQYAQGAEIVSLCIGAFILASSGLLKGKNCTTHWLSAAEFSRMFPDVNVAPYKILTDEAGIYTSGGAYSSLNLLLYLVEKFAGRDMAILASKIFEIDIDRHSQSPFIMFRGQKEHEDEPVKKAQEYIEDNFRDKITVNQLAGMLALSRRSLERRFKRATSNTVIEYIQRVKIEAAKKGFETSRKNINEIMYEIGYSDNKAFRGVFKKLTGLSPVDYKNKYAQA
ncbi:transcriptional regulator GlxA family with amidase domain [Anseongella ginsenosidimutans]|uniref:Transcriptional regulator GlxA family with amidase domain n=1 Tax=Anseongella ginsenosidimutans TaxID=496056 RepID=A0A4R3KUS6_9SPHI|nr:helix-turn-helix domain-containing protein [Anseongella ginsenosidimutans]QEC51562.1 helix-turn-helix domain-containing protein [Anseongella ginsenosidimutans]TCS88888.1 transcriptional regulator GlxA family with amidase domain [Anseongella ginsenosidimutans]